jgi:hypothetical protein
MRMPGSRYRRHLPRRHATSMFVAFNSRRITWTCASTQRQVRRLEGPCGLHLPNAFGRVQRTTASSIEHVVLKNRISNRRISTKIGHQLTLLAAGTDTQRIARSRRQRFIDVHAGGPLSHATPLPQNLLWLRKVRCHTLLARKVGSRGRQEGDVNHVPRGSSPSSPTIVQDY